MTFITILAEMQFWMLFDCAKCGLLWSEINLVLYLAFFDDKRCYSGDILCTARKIIHQTITLFQDKSCPFLCPVKCAARIILRAKRLKQPDSMPVGCYRTKKTSLVYMAANRVATLIREAVKRERPDITTADGNKYSTHSLRVWACVFLDEAGKSPDYIRKRPNHR